jgi:two-component system chemotaxis sensor kinase CheA
METNVSKSSQTTLLELADKIALELVFAEPGKDTGLLPINSLLGEIETQCASDPDLDCLRQAAGLARQYVDAAFDAGALDSDLISRLGAWSCWVREALAAGEAGRPVPPLPEKLAAPRPPAAPVSPQCPAARGEEAIRLEIAGNAEVIREFVEEAQEHLHRIELDALALEDGPSATDTLHSLFRSFHTLKGGSGFLNLLPMNRLAHELETLLDLARQRKLSVEKELIDLILAGRDALRQFVAEIDRRLKGQGLEDPILVPTRALLERVQTLQRKPAAAVSPSPETAGPSVPRADQTAPGPDAAQGAVGYVKVDTVKLDNLIDLVGELVIAQSQVAQDAREASARDQQLSRNLLHLGRITNDLQHIAMSLRMVPIRTTFQKMNRLVRDVAAKAGKNVELRMSGEDTELDRNLIEQINDPLIHMIRNAVDHGVEKPETREARGKPARGLIHLRAFHQGGNVVIEVQDDGAGLDKERIAAKAREAGLVPKDAQLTEQEIFALIFAPGFSTAEKVTEISGRGVGMDVVRRNIEKLRGKIEVRSSPGQGSTFSIHLPLTLAIIDGLIFSVGRERFIVPTLCVRESFRPRPDMISTVQGRGEIVAVRGQFNPLVRLYERFGLEPETRDPRNSIIIVVETNHARCGLLVDRLLGKQEVVIKGLGDALSRNPSIAGAAILGDGRVGLILNVNELVRPGDARLSQN